MIADIPQNRADLDPHGPCLTDGRTRLDNAGFATAVRTAATTLAGLGPGDVLSLRVVPSIAFVTTVFAAWRRGATVRPVGMPNPLDADDDSLARIADSLADWYGMCPTTVALSTVDELVWSVVTPLLAGGSVVLSDHVAWTVVNRVRATYFVLGPARCTALLASPDTPGAHLRYVISPATPLPPELSTAFEQRYGVPVVDGFAHHGCHVANPPYGVRKPGTAGLPLPGVDIAIADPRGRLLSAGLPGEVLMRGPGAPRDRWVRTGRTGRFDQDGYLMLGALASSARAS